MVTAAGVSDDRPVPFDERYRCTAKSKRSGQRCRSRAVPGSNVCKIHGGGSPQARWAAARRLEEQRIATEIGQLVTELELDPRSPEEAILDAVARMDAAMRVLGARAADAGMDPESPWMRAYMAAVRDTHALAAKVADLRLDERRVLVHEAQADLLVAFVRDVLADLGFDIHDPDVSIVMRRRWDALPRKELLP